ncbi:MAG: hypothetical protein HQK75_07485 [Candidatus Magnetomorum sp.]|nr:hypothetical protein [Candidatus Magnetomorum sp.]
MYPLSLLYPLIQKKLCQDKPLDSKHRFFLSNTFGLNSFDDIRTFLVAEPEEAMSFYDLLFSPDETFQIQLEPLLSREVISIADRSQLIDRLSTSNLTATILFEQSLQGLTVTIDPIIISAFIYRLHLSRTIPISIRKMLPEKDQQQWRVLVQLRNEAIPWTEKRSDFIARIIQTFLDDDAFPNILSDMLHFCKECEDQSDFVYQLKKRKRQLSQNLNRYQHGQALYEKHSMEFLMVSGIRPIHLDVEKTNKTIRIIDKVLNDLFGTNEFILPENYTKCYTI